LPESEQQPRQPDRNQQTRAATERRQHGALGQQLPHDAPPAGADREPDGNLPASCRRPRQQQIGDIGAGDQQHQADRSHQQLQRQREIGDAIALPAASVEEEQTGGIGPSRKRPGGFRQRRLRLLAADLRFQPSEHTQPAGIAIVQFAVASRLRLRLHHHRHVDIVDGAAESAGELRRRDPDDGVRLSIQADGLAEGGGIAAESPAPQSVTDDGNRIPPRGAIFVG
jgi:hypothetical protein